MCIRDRITDEPGIYIEGSHGIRTENELVVRKGEETEYGQFMYFEPITYVPIDLDAINPDLLREDEKMCIRDRQDTTCGINDMNCLGE